MTILEVINLSKKFGGLLALNDLSFSVEEGEILGIIGANGAGKTTLFNIISGFSPPSEGTILLSDPNDFDSDNDGYSDYDEVQAGTSSSDANDHPEESGSASNAVLIAVILSILGTIGVEIAIIKGLPLIKEAIEKREPSEGSETIKEADKSE